MIILYGKETKVGLYSEGLGVKPLKFLGNYKFNINTFE